MVTRVADQAAFLKSALARFKASTGQRSQRDDDRQHFFLTLPALINFLTTSDGFFFATRAPIRLGLPNCAAWRRSHQEPGYPGTGRLRSLRQTLRSIRVPATHLGTAPLTRTDL